MCLIHGMKGDKGYKVWKKETATGVTIPLHSGGSLQLSAGVSHHKLYVTIGFKPAFLSLDSWDEIEGHLSYMLPDGYQTAIDNGRVSYFEIAVDVFDQSPSELIVFDKRLQVSTLFWPKSGGIPTQYLGPKGGTRVMALYDRAGYLNKSKPNADYAPISRIEARLRRLSLRVPELIKCKNPFLGVGVCRFKDAAVASDSEEWKAFVNDCGNQGTAVALGKLSKYSRKKFRALLTSLTCSWWNPDAIWEGYSSALTTVPGAFTNTPE